MRFRANGIYATVRSPAIGHFLDSFVNGAITLFEIDCLGPPMFPRHFEPFRNSVDRDDTTGAEHPCALDRELPDWTTAPYRHRIAVLDAGILGGHITGRIDV